MLEIVFVGIGSYLIGSLPMAVIVCHILYRSNPLKAGSGNPGATNVVRLHGRRAGALVFALDFFKGVLAVYIAMLVIDSAVSTPAYNWLTPISLLAVNLGHAKSVFLRFSGGKCVSSGLGALAMALPWLAVATATIWLIVFGLFRLSAGAAVASFAMLVPTYLALTQWGGALPGEPVYLEMPMLLALVALTILVLIRHRQNYAIIAGKIKAITDRQAK